MGGHVPADKVLRYVFPAVAVTFVLDEEKFLLLLRPGLLIDGGTQVVVPSLAALLAGAALHA